MHRFFRSSRLALAGLAFVAASLGAACSAEAPKATPKPVPKANVEVQTLDGLEKVAGRRPESITCPGDLEAKIGATMRCELGAGGQKLGVTLTVNNVSGRVAWQTVVDPAPVS